MNSKQENIEYNKERVRQIFELRKESDMLFDKQIRYISSGAIALSVTLISSIREISLNWLLLVAWICLILTLLLNLISYKVAVKALDYDILEKPQTPSENKYDKLTSIINICSILTLIAGLVFLVLFFYQIK